MTIVKHCMQSADPLPLQQALAYTKRPRVVHNQNRWKTLRLWVFEDRGDPYLSNPIPCSDGWDHLYRRSI
jgi:hypothetical protein